MFRLYRHEELYYKKDQISARCIASSDDFNELVGIAALEVL